MIKNENNRFKLYQGGVYNGIVRFEKNSIMIEPVDPKSRVQLQEYRMGDYPGFVSQLPLEKLGENMGLYNTSPWHQDSLTLANGEIYNRYLTYPGQVTCGQDQGRAVQGQLWARRQLKDSQMGPENNVDLITVDEKVVAFVLTGRLTMEILVLEGYESVTPLEKYNQPQYSKAEYGVDYLGNQMVKTRDDVHLATDVYLPYPLIKGQKVPTIVIRTCYGKEGYDSKSAHWINRGYALVVQDVRGRTNSEGDLIVFSHERDDASDLFDWIVDQEWSCEFENSHQ